MYQGISLRHFAPFLARIIFSTVRFYLKNNDRVLYRRCLFVSINRKLAHHALKQLVLLMLKFRFALNRGPFKYYVMRWGWESFDFSDEVWQGVGQLFLECDVKVFKHRNT